jgi:DNA-binding beta-propeller fold protein YncE
LKAPHARGALASALPWLAAVAGGPLLLAACGGAAKREVPVAVSQAQARTCPGGMVSAASARGRARLQAAGARAGRSSCPYVSAAAIGTSGEGVFRQPEAIAVAPSGRVYVADQFSHLVQMFSSMGTFEGQWGSAGAGPGKFGAVGGLAIGPGGEVYLVDATNDRVERYTADGRYIGSWGSRGTGVGQFDFGAGNGPSEPPGGGVAVGGGHVCVADTKNNRIERFALDGSGARVIAGSGSRPGDVRRPQGLALAAAAAGSPEALYVADNGNDRVQELAPAGGSLAAASSFPATPATFQNPYDVAADGDSVYVVDDNHGRIVHFDRALRFVGTFGGSGRYHLTHFPRAIALGSAGHVYVTDSSANRVVVFSADGAPLRAWGSSGLAPGQFVAPVDVAAGPGGRLLVAEAYREIVPLYSAKGPLAYRAQIVFGSPWSSGGGVTLGSRFFSPTGVAFAPDGTVWVSDRNNDVLRHLSANGDFITAVGSSSAGSRAAQAVTLNKPHGVAVQSDGRVLVADTGSSHVLRLAPGGGMLASWPSPRAPAQATTAGGRSLGAFREPLDVAAAPGGGVYVADTGNRRVEELDANGRLVASWGGAGSAVGRFESPSGIAVDSAGDVFVGDSVLDRIQEFTAHGALLAAWGRRGSEVGELGEPTGMTVDCHGDLLVADTGNNRVQLFTSVAPGTACDR